MIPPIRYPLPSFVAILLLSLLTWQGAEWSREWRAELARRASRALEGPPVPRSDRPKVVAGPITRRGLLLRGEMPVSDRPRGSTTETIDRRMFVDIYDEWPEPGPITHVRVGNRNPIGWIPVEDLLRWDTRLVIRAPGGKLNLAGSPGGPATSVEVGHLALPVLGFEKGSVEVAVWDPAHPWSRVARRGWVPSLGLPPDVWGVWISQVELPILLRLTLEGEPRLVRLRAIVGRLTEGRVWNLSDLESARPALPLPSLIFEAPSDPRRSAGRLAEANSRTEEEASWSGLSFRFLPISDLP